MMLGLLLYLAAAFTQSIPTGAPPVPTSGGGGCGSGYAHYATLTVNSTSVVASATYYPLYFAGNAFLKSTSNSGYVQTANAYDVIFCSASSGGTQFKHELVAGTYNASTGAGEWWIDTGATGISSSSSTVLYMFFGNSSATDSSNTTGVWSDDSATLVSHLSNGSTLSAADSTGNWPGTIYSATATTGELDGAAAFSGSSQYIDYGVPTIASYTQLTISKWVQCTVTPVGLSLAMWDNTGPTELFVLDEAGTSNHARTYLHTGVTPNNVTGTTNMCDGSWHNSVMTWILGGNLTLYIDGASQGSTGTVGSINASSAQNFWAGKYGNGGSPQYWTGNEDEIEVHNIQKSAQRVQTDYNNQSAPTTFYTVGSLH